MTQPVYLSREWHSKEKLKQYRNPGYVGGAASRAGDATLLLLRPAGDGL